MNWLEPEISEGKFAPVRTSQAFLHIIIIGMMARQVRLCSQRTEDCNSSSNIAD